VGKPLIAIPTTSGTGTEATCFAVVYIDKTKYSLKHSSILPDYTIIDPTLTHAMPPLVTAATGMDALAQAIESYWGVKSTHESQAYAREAITLTLAYLKAACQNEVEARDAMSRAANLAGKAINLTETTACHAVSYPITSYFNVPHGHAVALTLASMFGYINNLRSMSQGRAQYTMTFDHYDPVPAAVAEEVKKKYA
jgi:alcohol dehydrogenase class IV